MYQTKLRVVCFILTICMLLTACGAPTAAPQTEPSAADVPQIAEAAAVPKTDNTFDYVPEHVRNGDSIKLLMFGNSYTANISTYVWQILHELGYKEITIGRMWISDASLKDHADRIKAGTAVYDFCVNTSGEWESQGMHDAAYGASYTDWDFITLQHQSTKSAIPSTFEPSLSELVSFFTEKAPNAKLAWYLTWAYTEGHIQNSETFKKYFDGQTDMYQKLVDALSVVEAHPEFVTVLPVGTAVQNMRTLLGDVINKDGSHLALGMTRYAVTMAYVKGLTGRSIDDLTGACIDDSDSKRNQEILAAGKLAVNAAFKSPRAVTQLAAG